MFMWETKAIINFIRPISISQVLRLLGRVRAERGGGASALLQARLPCRLHPPLAPLQLHVPPLPLLHLHRLHVSHPAAASASSDGGSARTIAGAVKLFTGCEQCRQWLFEGTRCCSPCPRRGFMRNNTLNSTNFHWGRDEISLYRI